MMRGKKRHDTVVQQAVCARRMADMSHKLVQHFPKTEFWEYLCQSVEVEREDLGVVENWRRPHNFDVLRMLSLLLLPYRLPYTMLSGASVCHDNECDTVMAQQAASCA